MKWISVNERLPKLPELPEDAERVCTTVIACYKSYSGELCVIPLDYEKSKIKRKTVRRWNYRLDRIFTGGKVLYWMPLPAPPVDDEKPKRILDGVSPEALPKQPDRMWWRDA